MPYSKIIKSACAISSLACMIYSTAYQDYNMRMKGRLGYVDAKEKISTGSDGTAGQQKFRDGLLADLGISYFFTPNFALELSAGVGTLDYRKNSGVRKNIFFIPVSSMAQVHFPINEVFDPYLGAGYSYSFVEREPDKTEIKNAGGIAFQAGIDILQEASLGFNVELKYVLAAKHDITVSGEKFNNELSKMFATVGVTIPF